MTYIYLIDLIIFLMTLAITSFLLFLTEMHYLTFIYMALSMAFMYTYGRQTGKFKWRDKL